MTFHEPRPRAFAFVFFSRISAKPSADILFGGNGLKVRGVNARSIPAKMVNLVGFWNGSDQQLVNEAVC